MRSQGSLVLSDLAAHYLMLDCEQRGRRGVLNFARFLDHHRDAKLTLTDHTPRLANRDNARAFSLYDRCKARYGLCP